MTGRFLKAFIAAEIILLSNVAAVASDRASASYDPNDAVVAAAQAPSISDETADLISHSQALRRKLSQVGIAAVAAANDPNDSEDLMKYIRQLESLRLPAPPEVPGSRGTVAASAAAAASAPAQTRTIVAETDPNRQPAEDTLNQRLNALLADPTGVVHAFNAAEALYKAGNYQLAASFYRVALEQMSSRENPDPDRFAWSLFQLANCLRLEDPVRAAGYYDQLVVQYPNSPWTAAAAVQQKLITWYGANRPDQLLETYSRDPNSPSQ